jgi:hypothetical protein
MANDGGSIMDKSKEEKIKEIVDNAYFVCESVDDLPKLQKIQDFLNNRSLQFVFRGVSDCTYGLLTTLHRHINEFTDFGTIYEQRVKSRIELKEQYGYVDQANIYLEETRYLLTDFASGLIRIGDNSFLNYTSQDMFENERHFGIPMQLLDFTYSFDIALFFAFNNLKLSSENDYVKIYALNTAYVHSIWDKYDETKGRQLAAKKGLPFVKHPFKDLLGGDDLFIDGEPVVNTLRFIDCPGEKCGRMQRQMGAMIYDTLDYKELDYIDLEVLIKENSAHLKEGLKPIITILIDKSFVREVLSMLWSKNINGSSLFFDVEGVVMDVLNTNYCDKIINEVRGIRKKIRNKMYNNDNEINNEKIPVKFKEAVKYIEKINMNYLESRMKRIDGLIKDNRNKRHQK